MLKALISNSIIVLFLEQIMNQVRQELFWHNSSFAMFLYCFQFSSGSTSKCIANKLKYHISGRIPDIEYLCAGMSTNI